MNYEKSTIGQRLKKWRKFHGFRLVGLSKKLTVAASSLSELENDKSLPSSETLIKLHYNTNLDIMWLLVGKGSMIKQEIGIENSNFYEEVIPYEHEERLKEFIKKLVQVYQNGESEKIARLKVILDGADPDH